MTRNPQAEQMAHESMRRTLAAQAEAIWPQERPLIERYDLPATPAVVDVGCGAGLDALIAARQVGPTGAVLGVDFSDSMLARAQAAAAECDTPNVTFCRTSAERLPVEDASVDVALVNGIFNLNPRRRQIMAEIARAVRPGGRAFVAELILSEPTVRPPAARRARSRP